MHDHDHNHTHGDGDHAHDHGEEFSHRDLTAAEQPLDAANQSLADALRASFAILKVIMLVLVVLYLFSNVRTVGGHEQALVLRMGRLLPGVRDAGLVKALPIPIDEIVRLPTKKSNDLIVDSHTFKRREEEIGKPLSFISRGHQGLNPSEDGALLTADSGLVHVQWKITYKIDNVVSFVTSVAGDRVDAAERLIRTLVETAGAHLATEMTADELIRTRVDSVQSEMRRLINLRLAELNSGITLTLVEVFEPTPPIQIRSVFDDTQKAENNKQKRIRDAEQQRIKILSEAAGAAYPRLIKILDDIDLQAADPARSGELREELGRVLEKEAEGKAGKLLKEAGAYYANVVQQIQEDLNLYRTLLPEYERSPSVLIGRLWEKTRQEIFDSNGVLKIYRPSNLSQFRLIIPLDPEQSRQEEEQRIQKKDVDMSRLRPERYRAVGPDEE